MDYRQQEAVIDKQIDYERKKKIEMQLLIAEAINFAYTASQPSKKRGQANPAVRQYKQWRKKKINILYPENSKPVVWNKLSKKSFVLN
jgi:hypothetical protein